MHDRNGSKLEIGDIVDIRCKIESLSPTPDYCNISCVSIYGRRPDGEKTTFGAFNTAQVVLVESINAKDPKGGY